MECYKTRAAGIRILRNTSDLVDFMVINWKPARKKKENDTGFYALVLFLLGILILTLNPDFILKFFNDHEPAINTQPVNVQSYEISLKSGPLHKNSAKSKDLSSLENDIRKYISRFKGKYGIYYLNLKDGSSFGINSTDEYIAASTVKIPINLYLFKKIEEGAIDPEKKITYLKEDYEGGTGRLRREKVGSKYSIRMLSKYSIIYSDNVATNMLLRLLGRNEVKDFMRELGGTVVSYEKNISCPRDMAIYMKEVYKFCRANPELGDELMWYFENTVFNDRIPKPLPKNIKVAHKTGNQIAALHDVGIVFTDTPYVLAIMSQNINEEEADDVIAEISRMVYDYVS